MGSIPARGATFRVADQQVRWDKQDQRAKTYSRHNWHASPRQSFSDTDGLLLNAKTAVYLSQGRLDRIPFAKLKEFSHHGGDPTWLAILRMLSGQTDESMELLRSWLERRPLDNNPRMFMGELLCTQGDTANAIRLLERTLQQGPRHMTPALYLTLAYLDAGQLQPASAPH